MNGTHMTIPIIEANGARIPALGFGTWQLRGRPCVDAVKAALDIGYRHEYARYKRTDAEGGGNYSRHMPTLQVRWNF